MSTPAVPPTAAQRLAAIRAVQSDYAVRIGDACYAASAGKRALAIADIAADAQVLGGLDLAADLTTQAIVGAAT